ncbi:PAS domain S-box protein [bacterium]|nr:PAS domain S-box protein [bacterium]
MKNSANKYSLRSVITYFIIASVYILLSDRAISFLLSDPERINRFQTIKGLAFVVVTSLVLFFDIRKRLGLVLKEKQRAENAREAMEQSEATYRNMANYSSYAKLVVLNGLIVYANPACLELFGTESPADMVGKEAANIVHPDFEDLIRNQILSLEEVGQSISPTEIKIIDLDGETIDVECSASLFPYQNQNAVHIVLRDITNLLTARRKVIEQLSRLQTLRDIDKLILHSYDLDLILRDTAKNMLNILDIDAIRILERNTQTNAIKTIQKVGLSEDETHSLSKDKNYKRILDIILNKERRFISDLRTLNDPDSDVYMLREEDFIAYGAFPLISKGKVKGVLEIYKKAPLNPSPDWFDFLDTLAGQIVIAIDNIQSYETMRRSLIEISRAYDRTIEGWSRALELRDEETQGHTQRVTEYTQILAHEVGINEEEMLHVRHGVLLHDMGKLAIPDRILLKPGSLTQEEWDVMRQHPRYAFEMLQPIPYLRRAIDIPYCHHEKWDGTGYPRGLSGEQIPLSARVFSIIDVWDALRSDRPYRDRWPEEKILDHIHSLSGTHFDPEIVEAFFNVYDELITLD